jgi:uncharacterized membrane-anchored protein
MTKLPAGTLSKVPEVTLGFWVVKVLATTLGETGGDAVTVRVSGHLEGLTPAVTDLVSLH